MVVVQIFSIMNEDINFAIYISHRVVGDKYIYRVGFYINIEHCSHGAVHTASIANNPSLQYRYYSDGSSVEKK